MRSEQPSLFPGMTGPSPAPPAYAPFLPGVRAEESFLELRDLASLQQVMRECRRCGLRSGCRQMVFADGDPQASLMLVGEGPGQTEDELGLPFVGRAGQLLNQILAAIALRREEVYITNVVKCRPPGNRLPTPAEVLACRGCLEAQIRLVRPRIIVCLGLLATRTVLDPRATMGAARGQWTTRQGIQVIATYHPAALLRNPQYKRPAWNDFKSVRARLEEAAHGN
ncbi:MAG: uracil-DNA glycosylase [Syntrophomonadaceae bacterium]|jgi:DNA polymerase|nr:uracil-DNA glycosylase [Syntrophomonadaceae bacterium]MDH7497185.1 uracil-DNA glycosylase [Syntrophomonadaceae bacterium]